MPKQVLNDLPGAIPALSVFSQAVISNGHVYISGSIGCDGEHLIVGGVQLQAATALANMKAVLDGAGSGLEHIVKVTVYLTHMSRDYDVFNDVYTEFFSGVEAMPARTCIGVEALPKGAFVEVECIAEVAESDV